MAKPRRAPSVEMCGNGVSANASQQIRRFRNAPPPLPNPLKTWTARTQAAS